MFASTLNDHLFDFTGKYMFRNHHTEVTCHSREFRNTFVFAVEGSFFHDLRHVQNGNICLFTDSVIIQNLWMNFAQESNHFSVVEDVCLSARM